MRYLLLFMLSLLTYIFLPYNIAPFTSGSNDTVNIESNVTDNYDITIEDAISLALKNSLDIETQELTNENQKWALITCWNQFIPNVSVSADISRINQKTEVDWYEYVGYPTFFIEDTLYQPEYYWGIGLNFNVSLNLHASMIFGIKQAVLDWKSGLISKEIVKKTVISNTKKSFYNLILIHHSLILLEERVQNSKFRYEIALRNFNKGIISKYDMITAQVAYENQKPNLIETRTAYQEALIDFKQLLGIKEGIEITLNGDLEINTDEYNYENLINEYEDNNLDLQLLNFNLKSQENLRNQLISYLTPSFSFYFSMDPRFQEDPTEDDWFGDAEYMEDNWRQSSGAVTFALSLPLSAFFPLSREQMRIKEASNNIKQMNIQIEKNSQININRIKKLVIRLNKSKETLNLLNNNILIAKEAYYMADEAYKRGTQDLLQVQNAEDELNLSKYNLMAEKFRYIDAVIDLQYIINSPDLERK